MTPRVANGSLPRYSRDTQKRKEALNGILPSPENPSDHFPVVATVEWCDGEGCEVEEQSKKVCEAVHATNKDKCESTPVFEDDETGGSFVHIRFGKVFVLSPEMKETKQTSSAMKFS